MKHLLTLLMLGLFSAAIVGCEASAEIDPDDDVEIESRSDTSSRTTRRTTTIEPDGDRTTRTEVKVDR